jgi:hypothetical protein
LNARGSATAAAAGRDKVVGDTTNEATDVATTTQRNEIILVLPSKRCPG